MELWHPSAERMPQGDGGSFIAGAPMRGVLHTTEGTTFEGALSAMPHVAPHFLMGPSSSGKLRLAQLIPLNRAARTAQNQSGGVETNRQGAIQIELIGTADPRHTDWGLAVVTKWPTVYLDAIAHLMRWIETQTGIRRYAPANWVPYPQSYGYQAAQRMSYAAWNSFNGWCGHQHVPENDHGDPGAINIKYLLTRFVTPVTPTPLPKPTPAPARKDRRMISIQDPTNVNPKPGQVPYVALSDDNKELIAYFCKPFPPTSQVTDVPGGQVFKLAGGAAVDIAPSAGGKGVLVRYPKGPSNVALFKTGYVGR